MTVRFSHLVAAVGLWMTPSLPGLVAAGDVSPNEPARLAINPNPELTANQQLANAIAASLRQSDQVRQYCIDVAVQTGTAELSGRVADESQRQEVLRLVRSVAGVENVVDRLTLNTADSITPVQAQVIPAPKTTQEPIPLPREPAQLLPRAPTPVVPAPGMIAPVPSTAGPVIEPMPIIAGGAPSPYDLNTPKMPPYAWPTYAPYNNYSRVAYPEAYPYNAWPYIGPMYPFPKIPLGWRSVKLEWQDGHWWFSKVATRHDWWRIRYW